MYAKQAHQYIGESSLDEDHNDEDMNDGQSNNVSESTTTTSFKEDQIGASSYNYEEINLDDEQHIQKVNDEDVHVVMPLAIMLMRKLVLIKHTTIM